VSSKLVAIHIMPAWEEIGLEQLIENIMALSYDWGVSDGN
jgi:hypothetical protein